MLKVAVIGLGKLGLPVAVQFARSGLSVVGADIDPFTVNAVNAGTEPFPGEEHLGEYLRQTVAGGRLTATTDTVDAVSSAAVVVITVPLIINRSLRPDFGTLDSVAEAIGRGIQPGCLVILETTVPVGTTRNRLVELISRQSGLVGGTDFLAAFSPERVLTGRVFADLRRYPKIVGGIDRESGEVASQFYETALQFDARTELPRPNGVWNVGSCETAELVKLAETTYRDVNIALANTFARFAEDQGIDIGPVIEAANSQHFSHIHQPGIAVGGHCIPVYPHLYLEGDPSADLVRVARQANRLVPGHAVTKLAEELDGLENKRVVVLGASYRGGVKEVAFSGVWDVVAEIRRRGGSPVVHDPLFGADELEHMGFEVFELGEEADGAIIQTDHVQYSLLSGKDLPRVKVIYDGRRLIDPANFPNATILVIGGGSPTSKT